MRALVALIALGGLVACSPTVPDSAAGVGFNDPASLRAARDAELEGRTVDGVPLVSPTAVSQEPLDPMQTAAGATSPATGTNADIANEAAAALALANANSGVPPVQASPSNPPPAAVNTLGISQENDFSAVSETRSIESDAERIARTRESRTVVAPTEVPQRPAGASPNVVNYALATSHPKGTRVYSRSGLNLVARAQRACAKYPSPDQAQIAFLEKGGPKRDRLGLDPDGDGYACAWDPAPFRRAVKN